MPFLSLLFLFQFFRDGGLQDCRAETHYHLDPIEKYSSPSEVLLEDPVLPSSRGQTNLGSGSGSIENALSNQLAIPFTDYGRPGGLTQMRSLGASASETDVQALGISLNPPTGSGFDLSTFPQFIWSEFNFQNGPSKNALNPGASSGTLVLTPWTHQAITSGNSDETRITEALTSGGLNQISAGHLIKNSMAVLAGYNSGSSYGPSASGSSVWGTENSTYSGGLHFLATDLDSETLGPVSFPTPQARSHNTRIIPVLENDFRVRKSDLLKTSVFYDWSYVGYRDPQAQILSDTYSQQWGGQLTYLTHPWQLGLTLRQVSYSSPSAYSFEAPIQTLGTLQATHETDLGSLLITPTVQGVWVTGFGLLPQGSLGIKKEWDQGTFALFSRTNFSRTLPSLIDRYGHYSDFVGNPHLLTELDWTQTLGGELKTGALEAQISFYTQYRQNPRVLQGATVTNLDDAYITGLMSHGTWSVTDSLEITNSLTLTESRILATSTAFPYLPQIYNLLNFNYHFKTPASWQLYAIFRASSSRSTATWNSGQLPGYFVSDLATQVRLEKSTTLFIRAENIFDRPIELIQGYPLGRTLSVAFISEI